MYFFMLIDYILLCDIRISLCLSIIFSKSLLGTVVSPKIITKSDLTDGLKSTEDPHDRLSSWLKNVRLPLEQIQRDITLTEKNFKQLSDLLEQIEPKKGSSDFEVGKSKKSL